mgnify:CR=1 FL=1
MPARTTRPSPRTASPRRLQRSSPPSLGITQHRQRLLPSRSTRSSRPTCCWPCSTLCSQESLHCLVGICAECSRWSRKQVGRLLAGWRYPLDPPGGVRPDGLSSARPRVAVQDAARHQPLRLAACAAAGQLVICPPAALRSWRSASGTESPAASSSTCRRCPTRPCWSMVHQLSDAEQVTVLELLRTARSRAASSPNISYQAACWSTCSPIRRSVRSTTCTPSRSPSDPHEGKSLLVLCPGDHLAEAHVQATERTSVRGGVG